MFFLADLLVVYLLTELVSVPYVISVAIGFTVTTAALFFANRSWAFKKRVHPVRGLYAFAVAATTLLIVMLVTYAGVQYFLFHYLLARVIAGIFGFTWSYVMDSYLTFDLPPFA
jgi:putative flippase GtrA